MTDKMVQIELTHEAVVKIIYGLEKQKIFELDFEDQEEATKTQTLINYLKTL